MKTTTIVMVFLVFNCFVSTSKAEEFCVTTSQELFDALFTAGVNGESDHIKIALGDYIAPAAGWKYLEIPSETFDLKMSGGWFGPAVNACGQDLGGSPFNTTLDADMQGRVLEIDPSAATKIEISSISFINGFADIDAGGRGGGISIRSTNEADHEVLIENSAFLNNSGTSVGALDIVGANKVVIRNNLFFNNISETGLATLYLSPDGLYLDPDGFGSGYYVTNNTMMLNQGGLRVRTAGHAKGFIANNLLWDNYNNTGNPVLAPYDLQLNEASSTNVAENIYLYNNDIKIQIGEVIDQNQAENISIQPVFEVSQADPFGFTPHINSPLVGGGKNSPGIVPIPTPFYLDWGIGLTDFEGNSRRQGDEIDIGAVESPHQMYIEIPIFKNGFEAPE